VSVPVRLSKEQTESVYNKNENILIPLLYDRAIAYSKLLSNMKAAIQKTE